MREESERRRGGVVRSSDKEKRRGINAVCEWSGGEEAGGVEA